MTGLSILFFAAALTVKPGGADLRGGCEAGEEVITRLREGTQVDLRFALNVGNEPCYKVSAVSDGHSVQGYLSASALKGVDAFENERVSARSINVTVAKALPPQIANAPADHPLMQASKLLEANQPRAALELAEKSMKVNGRDYYSLVIAGVAAYEMDDMKTALDYLHQARTLKADEKLDGWIAKIERENSSDKSGEKLFGTRFVLRYENGKLDSDTARTMIASLEQEFSRISAELGCRTEERIVTVVQSKAAYFASTGASEWSGGHYDGKIRIPMMEGGMNDRYRRAFAHEVVHACLAQMANYPAWLHEGLAQRLSGDSLTAEQKTFVRGETRKGAAPKLSALAASWTTASAGRAAISYAVSLAAVDLMMDRYRAYGIQNVLRNPDRLPQIAAELDKLME